MNTTDAKGRVVPPTEFANATVLIDSVDERFRWVAVLPVDQMRFSEERTPVLTDAERDRFLALMANPPKPGKTLRNAAVSN